MKRILKIGILFLLFIPVSSFSQTIFSSNETGSQLTAYSDGSSNDTIFTFCNPGAIASLSANGTLLGGTAPYTFTWSMYLPSTHRFSSTAYQVDNAVMSSTVSGLPTGGYRLIIKDALNATIATDIAWVWNINLTADAGTLASGCADFSMNGSIVDGGTNNFKYYNPPPDEVIINAATTISVCFTALHTYVSDLSFHLVGPPSCGSPDILLSPYPGVCNNNNNVNGLCFSTSSAAIFNPCVPVGGTGATSNYTGTYGGYSPGTMINWTALYGCDASQAGWKVQIYDCAAIDVGTFQNASISISNGVSTVNYSSTGSAAIADGSCTSASASSFTIVDTDTVPHFLTNVPTVNWTSNPATAITNATTLTPTVSPNPTVDTWFYMNVNGNFGCPKVDSVFFDYTPPTPPTISTVTVSPICSNGASFALSGAPTGGTWSGTGITDAVNGIFDPTVAGSGLHTITYAIGGCTGSSTVDITVALAATVAAVPNVTVCALQNQPAITLTPTPGASVVSWTNSDPSIGLATSGNGNTTAFNAVNLSNTTPVVSTVTVSADNGGCIGASTTFSITVNPLPVANAGVDTGFCIGGSVGLLATGGGTYNWLPATNISNSTVANPTVNPASSLSYSLTVTNGLGCSDKDTIAITVHSLPVVNAGNNTFACPGAPITPAAISVTGSAPFVYSWTAVGTINDPTLLNPAFTPTVSPTQYTLTATDAFGCVASDNVTISLRNLPNVTVSAQNPNICPGATTNLAASFTGAPAPVSYTWTPTSSVTSPNTASTPTSNTVTLTTTYTVAYTTSVGNGACVDTRTVTVTILPIPTAGAGTDVGLCPAGTAQLSGTGGGTYLWAPAADLDNATLQNPTTSTATQTQYTVTVTDGNGCKDTASVWAIPRPNPVVGAIDSTDNGCLAPSGTLTMQAPTVGTAPFTYSLNGGTAQAANTFTGLAAANYTITVIDAFGCSASDDGNVLQAAPPVVGTIDSTAAGCTVANGTLTMNAPTGNAPFAYSLNAGTPQLSNVFGSLTIGNYTITVIDVNGCSSSDDADVIQALPPVAGHVDSTAAGCTVANGTLTMQPVTGGLAPYTYSLNGGLAQASATFTSLTIGNYTITVIDANGCSASDDATIIQALPPVVGHIDSTDAGCTVANGTLTMQTATGGLAPYNYSLNGGVPQSSGAFTSLTAGNYTITVIDANGCSASDDATVLTAASPVAGHVDSTVTACTSATGTLTMQTPTGGLLPYTYSLNGGTAQASPTFTNLAVGTYTITVKDANGCTDFDASSIIQQNPPVMNGLTATTATCTAANGSITVALPTGGSAPYMYSVGGGTPQVSPVLTSLTTGNYTVTVTDAGGCTDTDVILVPQQLNTVVVDTATLSSTVCGSATGSLVVQAPTTGTAPYTYSNNGGAFQSSPTFSSLAANNYAIVAMDANGCLSLPNSFYIGGNITIQAAFNDQPSSGPYPLTVVFVNTSTGSPTSYTWDFGMGGPLSTSFSPSTNYPNPGTYNVILTAIQNNNPACFSQAFGTIVVFEPTALVIPNVVTPNGDGINDEFKLSGTSFKHLDVSIFDRWGRKVTDFEGDLNTAVWKPTGISDGTYFCTIKATSLDDTTQDFSGFIQIIGAK